MRQLVQNVSTGELSVDEVPVPLKGPAELLVANQVSVISAGTERAVLEMGRASLVGKARARPDLVRKVVESARKDGLASTYAKVRGRLGEPNALGYSSCGVVLESCEGAPASPGDLVACGGAGWASHAEVIAVPRNLCARVPDGVGPDDAAYATMGSIALHGMRLSEAGLGDVVAVVGLGLVGQLAMELVAAAGGVVVGFDPDPARVEIGGAAGFQAFSDGPDFEAEIVRLSGGRGADAVLVTAASKSSQPLDTATDVARERATVCVVGDVSIDSPRAPLFAKELRLVVSRSYGPGRYDPTYEEHGIDYPAGYVRWTEGRNLAEVLRLMEAGALRPSRLTTHSFDIAIGPAAYAVLEGDERSLGIQLRYPGKLEPRRTLIRPSPPRRRRGARGRPRVGVVGAGAFARAVLIPQLVKGADITAVANRTGISAVSAAKRLGAAVASTDPSEVINSDDVDAVLIATRHDTHARYAIEALQAGKHVLVEKPLALDRGSLDAVVAAAAEAPGVLMVGFNRRFAAMSVRLRDKLGGRGPLVLTYRVNAGRLPRSHWTHDPVVGGGRIVGEACHFIDLLAWLADGSPRLVGACAAAGGSEPTEDNAVASLAFSDGSIGQLVYTAYGDSSLAKERLEVMGEVGAAVLDDFARLDLHKGGKVDSISWHRDKGHAAEVSAFLAACRSGEQPWPVSEMAAVMSTTFDFRDALRSGPPGVA